VHARHAVRRIVVVSMTSLIYVCGRKHSLTYLLVSAKENLMLCCSRAFSTQACLTRHPQSTQASHDPWQCQSSSRLDGKTHTMTAKRSWPGTSLLAYAVQTCPRVFRDIVPGVGWMDGTSMARTLTTGLVDAISILCLLPCACA